MASASGNTVSAIAHLVQGDEDAVREVTHRFNEIGLIEPLRQIPDHVAGSLRASSRS